MKQVIVLTIFLLSSLALDATAADRFIMKLRLPSGQTAVVAEGEYEARSTGSFSIRLYDAAAPGDETTFFIAGLVQGRDGTVENVLLADIDDTPQPEIVVIVRSVGTGSYLSAHGFDFGPSTLTFRGRVEGLPPGTDPVAALRESIKPSI